jgi:hypothetical protein
MGGELTHFAEIWVEPRECVFALAPVGGSFCLYKDVR